MNRPQVKTTYKSYKANGLKRRVKVIETWSTKPGLFDAKVLWPLHPGRETLYEPTVL